MIFGTFHESLSGQPELVTLDLLVGLDGSYFLLFLFIIKLASLQLMAWIGGLGQRTL